MSDSNQKQNFTMKSENEFTLLVDNAVRRSERQSVLTDKGNMLYDSEVEKLSSNLDRIWKDIETKTFEYNAKSSEMDAIMIQRYQEIVTSLFTN